MPLFQEGRGRAHERVAAGGPRREVGCGSYAEWQTRWERFLGELCIEDGRKRYVHEMLRTARNSLDGLAKSDQLLAFVEMQQGSSPRQRRERVQWRRRRRRWLRLRLRDRLERVPHANRVHAVAERPLTHFLNHNPRSRQETQKGKTKTGQRN